MNLDRDQLAQTLRQVALPALAGAAGTGALGAYMSSQSDRPGELPSQRRHRILRNALVSAGLGGMAGAALPAGLKMLSEPYIGSGAAGGPGLVDKGVDAGLSNALPLAAAGGAGVFAKRRMDTNQGDALSRIYKVLGANKGELPPGLAESVGYKSIQNADQVQNLFGAGDRATKFLLNRLAVGAPGEDTGKLFGAADLMRTAGHPGVSLNDLKRIYKPSSPVQTEDFPISFHRQPEAIDWPGEYSKYLRTSNSPADKLLSAVVKNKVNLGPLGERAVPAKLTQIAQWLAERSRPGTARMLGRFGGPLGKLGLLGAGGAGIWAANKIQNRLMGN